MSIGALAGAPLFSYNFGMKIEWFGHAYFKINDSLVIDPYKDGSVPGYTPLRLEADKVICSQP